MIIQEQITNTLRDSLKPLHLEVINESHMHSVPPGSETHFKVIAVSDSFLDQSLVYRHRTVNELLAEQIAGPVHALSIHAITPEEWEQQGGMTEDSPLCLGGSKKEKRKTTA